MGFYEDTLLSLNEALALKQVSEIAFTERVQANAILGFKDLITKKANIGEDSLLIKDIWIMSELLKRDNIDTSTSQAIKKGMDAIVNYFQSLGFTATMTLPDGEIELMQVQFSWGAPQEEVTVQEPSEVVITSQEYATLVQQSEKLEAVKNITLSE